MKYLYSLLGLMFLSQINIAQNQLHSVLILNEGRYDYVNQSQAIPVSLGKYDPKAKSYEKIKDIVGVRFASDLLIHDNYILLAADTALIKLDRYTYEELDRVGVRGIRKLAIHENEIFVTRGEYLVNFDSYLHVYDLNDLSLLRALDTNQGPKYASEGMVVVNGKVYVAVNNAFDFGNELGFVGIYDPATASYGNEIQLPDNATNPDNLMTDGDKVYTLNNHSFDKSSISIIDAGSSSVTTSYLANVSSGCGTSALHEGNVLYQEMMEQTLYGFHTVQQSVNDSFELNQNFYGLAVEPTEGHVYATTTDFVSKGALLVYDNWNRLDSIAVGVSAGNIAFDIRDLSSLDQAVERSIAVYPNPANEKFHVSGLLSESFALKLFNLNGQKVLETNEKDVDVSGLNAGIYLLRIETQNKSVERKLSVQ